MNTKEIKITPPEGYKIDRENSTFECIKFKPIEKKRWRDDEDAEIKGCYINNHSFIKHITSNNELINTEGNYNIFATEKQAKSALAMARISQIMANDERFGGVITNEEWKDKDISKFILIRSLDKIEKACYNWTYNLLAFHTEKQADLFLKENEDLVRDYLML